MTDKGIEQRLRDLEQEHDANARLHIETMAKVEDLRKEVYTNGRHETTLRGEVSRLDADMTALKELNSKFWNKAFELLKILLAGGLGFAASKCGVDPEFFKNLGG